MTVQSCWIFKPREKPPVVIDHPKDTTVVVVPDTGRTPTDTIPPPTRIIFKDLYKVAVLLPFSIDDQFISDFDFKDRTTPYRSMMALELYQGMRMALDDLHGINWQVHVFDTRNSPAELNRILSQPEMKGMDVIIGPLFEHSVRTVAEFGLKNKIQVIAPLDQLDGTSGHPFLICANASIESHLSSLARFVHDRYPKNDLVIVRRNNAQEARLAGLFTAKLNEMASPIRPTEAIASGWELFPDGTFSHDTVLVFCPSEDEAFVNEVTRQLALHAEKHPIILIGMPTWLSRFESLSYDFLDQLNLHVTSGLWVDKKDERIQQLADRYREKYGIAPSDLFFRGYDLINWVALLMKNFGISYTEHFNEAAQDGLFSRFHILPANHTGGDSPSGTGHYENRYVTVLRYKAYELVKVN